VLFASCLEVAHSQGSIYNSCTNSQSSTFSLQVIIVIFIIVFVSITTSDSDNINKKEKMFTFVAFLAWLHYVKSW
jgi:hypothetical protein